MSCIVESAPTISCRYAKHRIGWTGVAITEQGVYALAFGGRSQHGITQRMRKTFANHTTSAQCEVAEFSAATLLDQIAAYFEGDAPNFDNVTIDWAGLTAFQKRVLRQCRRIPTGQTLSYKELAVRSGSPAAARAVGSVMANNRVPIIIPCHRVIGSGGQLGGFSAPQGIKMKQRMLNLEAGHASGTTP